MSKFFDVDKITPWFFNKTQKRDAIKRRELEQSRLKLKKKQGSLRLRGDNDECD